MANQIVEPRKVQGPSLRAVETFIKDYKKLTPEDIRNLDTIPYDEFRKQAESDIVKVMVQASDLGMNLEQYANLVSPETKVQQKRSTIVRLMDDYRVYPNQTDMTMPSTVEECMDGEVRQALLFHIITKSWDKRSIQDRNTIQLQTSSPLYQYPNTVVTSPPPPVPVGLRLNPGELVSTMHSVQTNSYAPFKWDYDREDMERTAVKPAQTIPASTLAEGEGNIPMQKWGNRFVLPYEMLTGGQGMRVNKLSQMVMLDSAAESVRQFKELIEILEKGDGANEEGGVDPSAAKVEKISEYGGTVGTFGFVPYLNWLDEALDEPFQITHVIMSKKTQRALRTAVAALEGDMTFQHLSSIGLAPSGMANMETQDSIRYGRAPDGALSSDDITLGIDARVAIEKVMRAGMTIRQQAEQIANQTREVVVSDTYLWARLANEAVKALNTAA